MAKDTKIDSTKATGSVVPQTGTPTVAVAAAPAPVAPKGKRGRKSLSEEDKVTMQKARIVAAEAKDGVTTTLLSDAALDVRVWNKLPASRVLQIAGVIEASVASAREAYKAELRAKLAALEGTPAPVQS